MNYMKLFFQLLLCTAIAFMTACCTAMADTKGQNEVQTTTENEDSVYQDVDQWPSFPGGEEMLMKYITKNLHCPESAIKNNAGRLTISFIVEKDSTLSHIEIIRCNDENLSEEGIRLIKSMPKWVPGKKDGNIVRVKYILPINVHPQ